MGRLRGSRSGALVVLAYGAVTLGFGVFELVVHLSVVQTLQGVLFVVIGLLALAGGVVWSRAQRRSPR